MSTTPANVHESERNHVTIRPEGRLAYLPSGRVAEIVATDGPILEAIILETGQRVDVHAERIKWIGGTT